MATTPSAAIPISLSVTRNSEWERNAAGNDTPEETERPLRIHYEPFNQAPCEGRPWNLRASRRERKNLWPVGNKPFHGPERLLGIRQLARFRV